MAEGYHTEEEQIEAIKKWWQENGKSTVISIVVAIAAVFGWQGWQQQQQAKIDAASKIYQGMLTAVSGANGNASPEQLATANHLADKLKQDFSATTYATFAALFRARLAVEAADITAAEQELRWVLDNGTTDELTLETKLRLARVLLAQARYDEALAVLTGEVAGYAAAYAETRGDIYQASGDSAQALHAFEQAVTLNLQASQPVNNQLLVLKLEQLKSQRGLQDNSKPEENAEGE